jgi:hypothetical protein
MSTFGSKVYELLDRIGKDAAWLAAETGITPAAISKWKTDAKRMPKPSSVKKVVRTFEKHGVSRDEILEAAGMTIRPSADATEREARRLEFYRANPRAAKIFDEMIDRLGPDALDEMFSFNEAWLAAQAKKPIRRRR